MHPLLYPYTEPARKYLATRQEIDAGQLQQASQHIQDTLRTASASGVIWTEKTAQEEAVQFALSRMLLSLTGNYQAVQQYCRAQARRIGAQLQVENEEDFLEFAKAFFPSLEKNGTEYDMPLPEYLKYGKDLPNQALRQGRVAFDRADLIALLKTAVSEKIADVKADPKKVPELVRQQASQLEEALRATLPTPAAFAGKYLELPALQKIAAGVGEGKRFYGSMTLAIAALKDGLPKAAAEELLRQYAKNCSKGLQQFTEREALSSVDWAYKHPTIRLSMRTLREQQLVDEETMNRTEEAFRKLRETPARKRVFRGETGPARNRMPSTTAP